MKRKTILITGASSGLGLGMAKLFAADGHDLALCARRTDRLETLKTELLQANPTIRVEIMALDVNDHDAVFQVFRAFKASFGTLDRIILNAGMGKGASLGTGYFEANRQTAMTNFVAAIAQAEAAMEIFREQNAGHLVTMSSVSAVRGFRRALNVYSATKAGLTTLTEGLRVDVLGSPIRVSCIHPGFIRTELNEKVKKVPFIVDLETGCRALVKAINKEKPTAYVPGWPWLWMQAIMRVLPAKMLRGFS
ncbi:SDR family oxidoreductase [Reinekea blandensis]|uniref:Short chain dehydrogenase n=1 Tax=Reinekea blandensis MED297 TaxID=314283 RepID=A4BGV5_9GAMM|nr:SDR family oxidoreductase [Reinekea blandensis]EAR08601.1 short chain dehydrogenase [Reinekea sp. MED297] [Reinekea blandensis MED297]